MVMVSKTIPGVALGEEEKRYTLDKNMSYYFCSFDEALARLRKKNKPKDESDEEDEDKEENTPPPPPSEPKPRQRKLSGRIDSLLGMQFGKLTVVSFYGLSASREALWLCRCECGNERVASGSVLKNGRVKSCGCLRVSNAAEMRDRKNKNKNK